MKEMWYEPNPPNNYRRKSPQEYKDYVRYKPREFVLCADLTDEVIEEERNIPGVGGPLEDPDKEFEDMRDTLHRIFFGGC